VLSYSATCDRQNTPLRRWSSIQAIGRSQEDKISYVASEESISPLGNRNSFVVTGGVETAVDKSWVVYSDVKLGLNAYKNSGASAASVQVGVGYRF
jgi:opacity protein-like surface antigen